jgi:hypothetical protein
VPVVMQWNFSARRPARTRHFTPGGATTSPTRSR